MALVVVRETAITGHLRAYIDNLSLFSLFASSSYTAVALFLVWYTEGASVWDPIKPIHFYTQMQYSLRASTHFKLHFRHSFSNPLHIQSDHYPPLPPDSHPGRLVLWTKMSFHLNLNQAPLGWIFYLNFNFLQTIMRPPAHQATETRTQLE